MSNIRLVYNNDLHRTITVCCHTHVTVGQVLTTDFEPICPLCREWDRELHNELKHIKDHQATRNLQRRCPKAFELYDKLCDLFHEYQTYNIEIVETIAEYLEGTQ